ncbi:MAG: tRNA (adenosine(37)-N6)-threonylcarbamoyltransferase complex ATPase subunit type 1 TsaE [Pseudomonadota bacterium]
MHKKISQLIVEAVIENPTEMENLGYQLSLCVNSSANIAMDGQLGAGKTTLVRGFVQSKGHDGSVKSPTYTFIESYFFSDLEIHHIDLYRLTSPEDIESLTIPEYIGHNSVLFIEWASNASQYLARHIDIHISIDINGLAREVKMDAITKKGEQILASLCITS